MIIDHLSNSDRYKHLHPMFAKSFEYLKQTSLQQLANGKTELNADDLFVLVSRNGNSKAAEPKMEVHRKYIDIHFVAEGWDMIGWKFLDTCEKPIDQFNIKDDYQLFGDSDFSKFKLDTGKFMIVYPYDAHAPLIETENLFKLVIKVKI